MRWDASGYHLGTVADDGWIKVIDFITGRTVHEREVPTGNANSSLSANFEG